MSEGEVSLIGTLERVVFSNPENGFLIGTFLEENTVSPITVGLSPEKPSEISYRYRTLLYMNANIVFRHKSFYDLQFTKPKAFLLQKEEGAWKFDLIQMIRSPYYSPENS